MYTDTPTHQYCLWPLSQGQNRLKGLLFDLSRKGAHTPRSRRPGPVSRRPAGGSRELSGLVLRPRPARTPGWGFRRVTEGDSAVRMERWACGRNAWGISARGSGGKWESADKAQGKQGNKNPSCWSGWARPAGRGKPARQDRTGQDGVAGRWGRAQEAGAPEKAVGSHRRALGGGVIASRPRGRDSGSGGHGNSPGSIG